MNRSTEKKSAEKTTASAIVKSAASWSFSPKRIGATMRRAYAIARAPR
jgi:hypothetical protein